MPTAHEYRAAALRLRRLAVQVPHDTRVLLVATGPGRIAGGPLRATLERALDDADASVMRVSIELERLAAVCDRRAEICLGYAAELTKHRLLGWPVLPPDPPAWWVEG